MKEINTYEEYVEYIENEMEKVINNLYAFKKTDNASGMKECQSLAELTFNLGSVSNNLRGILNNRIPTQYELLDNLFNKVDVNKLDNLFCLALLRYTFTSRNGMKQWIRVRDEIKEKLEKDNLESKKLLKGLL